MSRVKVLIVDDSALVREVLTKIINSHPSLEVVGTAPNPYIAVEKIKKLNPDVITLDIEMPEMDGLTFLEKLMKVHPMPVVMISTWTRENSEQALRALGLGAVDFIEKPASDQVNNINRLGKEIIEKVRCAAEAKIRKLQHTVIDTASYGADSVVAFKGRPRGTASGQKVILIGSSTGGTVAVEKVLAGLDEDVPGIVIVQHMPEKFTSAFAARLDKTSRLRIKEAEDGDRVEKGSVLIAPGGMHCILNSSARGYHVEIRDGNPVNRHKPSVDVLFRSAANCAGKNALGVILTGMGDDGAQGMLEMKQAGAFNIAQDEHTSVVFGMPAKAIEKGGVDVVVPLHKIPYIIMENV